LNVVRAPSLSWLGPLSFCPSPPSGLPSPSERAGRLLAGMAQDKMGPRPRLVTA
jgi:hypothetical protein